MIRLFKHYIPHTVILLGLADIILLLLASDLALRLRAIQIGFDAGPATSRINGLVAYAVMVLAAMIAVGVYGSKALRSLRFATARVVVAVALGIVGLAFLDFLFGGHNFWRSTLAYAMVLSTLLLVLNRMIVGTMLDTSAFRRRVMVLGAGQRACRLRALSARPESGFCIVSYIAMTDIEPDIHDAINRSAIPNLTWFVENLSVSEVVLALEERRNALPLADLLRIKTAGVHVNDFSSFIERETGRVDLETVNPSWLIFSDGFSSGRAISGAAKRLFDILASGLLLLLSAPFIALFALWVKFDSPGPAFFRQTRMGLYGQHFDLIKLRSMHIDAEPNGAQWALKDDPRITRLGRFIRKLRIDELPQAWSVLKGEMSFYPYGASIEDTRHKLEYDLYYAKNYTPFLDLLILLQTLRVVLWHEGAR